MAWWSRRKASRTEAGAAVSDRRASRDDLDHLRDFAKTRRGVEAYVEPATSVTQTTVVFVAGDGEWTRRRIPSHQAAAELARKLQIPVYDTNRVGYPQRMREYDLRARKSASTRASVTSPPTPQATPQESAAIMTLESIAGADPLPDGHTREELDQVWRQARAKAHPDRRGGDRSAWDKVEAAARVLGLES